MPYQMPPNTKFAAIHFDGCSTGDLPDYVSFGGDWSAHSVPVMELSEFDNRRIGSDRAAAFKDANLVLVAARPSARPTDRDTEWQELEQQVFRLFYGMLMFGIPGWRTATLAVGGRDADGNMFAGHIKLLWYSRNPFAPRHEVTVDDLRNAAGVAKNLQRILPMKGDFQRMKRGIYRLSRGWREEVYLADRLHEFVRALDGVMYLSRGQGEDEFVNRAVTFATSSRMADIAREIYRLRSFNEHLSDWPSELGYIKEADRDRLVAERALQAELMANAAYRCVLGDSVLLESFRNDVGLNAFWLSETGKPLAGAVNLDARSCQFQDEPNS